MASIAIPVRNYLLTFVALLVLTAVTVAAARFDLGPFSLAIALGIAFSKAALVALFFMHVRGAPRLIVLIVIAGLFWLGILLGLSFTDYLQR